MRGVVITTVAVMGCRAAAAQSLGVVLILSGFACMVLAGVVPGSVLVASGLLIFVLATACPFMCSTKRTEDLTSKLDGKNWEKTRKASTAGVSSRGRTKFKTERFTPSS